MLALAAKLLALFALPTTATIFWKLRSRTAWACVLAGLAAFAIAYLANKPIGQYYFHLYFTRQIPIAPPQFSIYIFAFPLAYGLIKIGIWWAVMRFKAARINTWQAAVLFGLAYTSTAAILSMLGRLDSEIMVSYSHFVPIPDPVPEGRWDYYIALREIPLDDIINYVSNGITWIQISQPVADWNLAYPVQNIAIALAILYSIKTRKIWPLGAALLCYMITAISGSNVTAYHAMISSATLLKYAPFFDKSIIFLARLIPANPHEIQRFIPFVIVILPTILGALPVLALALYVHRTNTRTPNPEPPQ